jgi:hypothetical protein
MSDDLAARLDEVEAAANRGLSWLPIDPKPGDWTRLMCDPVMGPFGGQTHIRDVAVGLYVGRMSDPARVLREIEAVRAILARHQPLSGADGSLFCAWCSSDTDTAGPDFPWPCPDVQDLAVIYQDSRPSLHAAQNPAVSDGA